MDDLCRTSSEEMVLFLLIQVIDPEWNQTPPSL